MLPGYVPVECDVIVRATNPASNPVAAELLRMDWMLLLDGRKAVRGVSIAATPSRPARRSTFPSHVALNLGGLLRHHGPNLMRLALALAGESSSPVEVSLRVVPLIDTPLGTMRFPDAHHDRATHGRGRAFPLSSSAVAQDVRR